MITAVKKLLRCRKGQAAIETGLSLPFLVFLLYYTINAYHMIHTSHVAQRYAAMNMYERLDNRAVFVVDDVAKQLITKNFIGVQYMDANGGAPPVRRIIFNSPNQNVVNNAVGICMEPSCN